jgi:hypothetical protein
LSSNEILVVSSEIKNLNTQFSILTSNELT